MNATSKEKLKAWLKRPRASFGIIAGVVSFVVLVSIAGWFDGAVELLTAKPWILLGFVAISLCVGAIVQHRYTLLVGKAIFSPGSTGWRHKVDRISTYAKESNLVLCFLIALGVGYPTTLYYAARSIRTIVAACETNLNDQLAFLGEGGRSVSISSPICLCLSEVFLERNGVLRLALFNTSVFEVSDFQGITEEDEQQCLNRVISGGQSAAPQRSSSQ
ncbi:hypothetical protein LOY54_13420 [Pseudomonas sp. B21-032]|uniref:hypothetical protein n=1 Tax=Pseudomonas sp. B21-032 TaxID=2895483 RepID=UPI00215E7DEF|nr:hypothetical protein [Pseudomonas sp. B21-032]UVL64220.1 hypothetical protein LOY54_13420 [Pseudomonas sp. B21-032]